MGLLSILTIIFVVCKLIHVIDWSWWTVFIPTYIDIVVTIVVVIGVAIVKSRRRK